MSSPVSNADPKISSYLLDCYKQSVCPTSSQSLIRHKSANPAVASYAGRWDRGGTLGYGNFAQVFLDCNADTGELRAVKKVLVGRSDWIAREIECMVLVKSFSTNFVGLQCWYEHHDTIYIAMDNHTWGDLNRHIISFGPYEESGAKDIAEQLVQAVLVLHELGIVHRDIKPENILVASDSPVRILLADFGLAKSLEGPTLIGDDTPLGTPDWASPEQSERFDGYYDEKVDMWSVGCVVYFSLTSLNPFSDRDQDQDLDVIERYRYPFWPRVSRKEFYEPSLGHSIAVRGVSCDANRFLRELIVCDPLVRMSAHTALKHKWINPTGIEPMGLAVRRGNIQLIELLTSKGAMSPSWPFVLRVAAANGHLKLSEQALWRCQDALGIPVIEQAVVTEMPGLPTQPALVGAASNGDIRIVRLLVKHLEYCGEGYGGRLFQQAVQSALQHKHNEVVDELWPHLSWKYASELSDNIARFGSSTFLRNFMADLNRKMIPYIGPSATNHCTANVEALEQSFAAMMTAAAHQGNIDNINILLESRPRMRISRGALYQASKAGHLNVVKRILDYAQWVFSELRVPRTDGGDVFSEVLQNASRHGHLDIVRYLVARCITPNQKAIDAAVENNHPAVFRHLVHALRHIYKLNATRVFQYIKPEAIAYCDLSFLNWHPDRSSLSERLELHVGIASRLCHLDVVEWLINNVPPRGGDLTDAIQEGLVGASENGHLEIVKFLLNTPVRVNITRPLKRAAGGGHIEVLELLLSIGSPRSTLLSALKAAEAHNQAGTELQLRMACATYTGPCL